MRLKKLELYGFKSFAQRTEIVFGQGITGIVGPNGSGKSNIGDAVRWVLGEQSAKTLRGTSMADVIFNGTQKRKPLSYCEVSLVFDNEDRALPMDYAEIMVTRRVYRNGDSEYYLNRAACRLKDIVDLFRDTGIGKEGYSIIGQGRIDEILSRKSEDRRQIFEEAAGIVKFKTRKEEADKKLQRTLENAARLDDILDELSRRLGPLERQSKAAREYLELSAELKTLDLNLFLIRSDRAKQRLGEIDGELMTLQGVLSDVEEELAALTQLRDESQDSIAKLDERVTQSRAELMACTESLHEAQSALSALTSRRETRSENRARILREQEEDEQKLKSLAALEDASQEDIERQTCLAQSAEAALEEARKAAAALAEEEQQSAAALDRHKADVLEAMNRLSDVRNDQTRLATMRAQMAQRLEEMTSGALLQREEETRMHTALEEARGNLDAESEQQRLLGEALEREQERLRQADAALAGARAQTEQLAASLQSTQSRWKLLSEMTREMEGYSQSVRRAVQYAKDHGLQGARGVLAQLISVPARFETAIDMALGASQQNIVTDHEQTAKQLIDYLRQNRLGRATFLPMSTVKSRTLNASERRVLGMQGSIGVASDLISFPEEYRGVVENLLGRTVIAENLDCGIPIMRAGNHAFRLVTLEGDVMNPGGSMTGGSAQSKLNNLLSREREVKELAATLRTGREKLEALKKTLDQREGERNHLRIAVQEALHALHQQEIVVARETERRDSAQTELETHRIRMRQTGEAAEQLRESIGEIDRQLQEISLSGSTHQTDSTRMEEKTAELQEALTRARAALAQAQDRVMERTLQLSDAKHTLDVTRMQAARSAQDREAIESALSRRHAELEQMERLDQMDQDAAQTLATQVSVRQSSAAQCEEAVQRMESARAKQQEELRHTLTQIEQLHERHDRDADRRHRVELTRARVDGELRALQDRIWNTYEVTYAGAEAFRVTEGFSVPEAERRVGELNGRIRALGTVNVGAVEEYAEAKQRFDELSVQQNDLRRAEADLRELIGRLLEQMRVTFVDSFEKLQGYFSETFTRLFGGGHAELKLTDPDDPLGCGIEVNAQPPGKKLQLLSLLSGGERALCAIAILFAMLKLKPTPFCILDEIEAALDDANIGYYADYLTEYSRDTQFIVVTHRKGTMERCNSLYGVAMEEQGVSRMVSVSLQDYQD